MARKAWESGMIDRRTLIGAASATLLTPRGWAQSAGSVRTAAGAYQGVTEQGVRVFRGIRYGRAERFQAPRSVPAPAGIQPADRFGPVSPQSGSRYGPQSEDCLFLNIWTADANPRARKPVMLYIHGGAYSGGSVTDPL